MITYSVFVTEFPTFATLEPHLIESAIRFAETNYCHNWVPLRQDYGRMLVAAHFLHMGWFAQAEMAGSATGIAQGQTATAPSQSDDDFSMSFYGRQYRELQSINPVFPAIFA